MPENNRRRSRSSYVVLAVMALVVASGQIAAQIGSESIPHRIVSVVPAVTEMLFAIGAGPQVVGVSSFDRVPEEVAQLPKVGALLDPDMERIFSLRPDLVVLYGSHIEQSEQLDRASIPVFIYRHGGLADVTVMIRQLGEQLGHQKQARNVATEIERELNEIRHRVSNRTRPDTLLVFGREPGAIRNVYASGGVGFLHDIIDVAGGRNVFSDVSRETAHPNSETILARAPDVIVELRANDATDDEIERETATWNYFSTLPAVRYQRVYFLTGSELFVPGPRVANTAKQIAELLHPDAFGSSRSVIISR